MISPAFAQVLAAGRLEFNRRTLDARRRHQAFDEEAFRCFLLEDVDKVIAAVAEVAADRLVMVCYAAYDMALELAGLRLAGPGAHSPWLTKVWRELAPCFSRLIATNPVQVLGMLSNAALYLQTIAGVRTAQWLREMAALSSRIESITQLGAVGQVLAWRAGAAHFRSGALAAASGLPDALGLAAFPGNTDQSWTALLKRLTADPWWRPDGEDDLAPREVGAFSGLGGEFASPPQLRATAGGFLVSSAGRHFLLLADAFGAVLLASSPADAQAAAATASIPFKVQGDCLFVGRQRIATDLPPDGLQVCASAATIAIASPYSHAIRLVPHHADL